MNDFVAVNEAGAVVFNVAALVRPVLVILALAIVAGVPIYLLWRALWAIRVALWGMGVGSPPGRWIDVEASVARARPRRRESSGGFVTSEGSEGWAVRRRSRRSREDGAVRRKLDGLEAPF